MDLAPTEQQIEAALDHSRIPDKHDLSNLLQWFFEPTNDAALGARFETEVRSLLEDPRRKAVASAQFGANSERYFGQAWKELVSHHRIPPTPTELAIWIALTTKGYPQPRPYCPASFVGAWRELQPSSATWQLSADGGVRTDDPALAARTRWCVHRIKPGGPSFENDEMWFTSEQLVVKTALVIREITATALVGYRVGLDGRIDYRLERA
jgi:hypothetical protein